VIFQLVYNAANPPVSGIGFAATRDLIAFLHRDTVDDAGTAGGAGELCYLDGSYLPFAKTKVGREATHDGRLSLEERYISPADYTAKVRAAPEALARDGYMLPEDARLSGRSQAQP
jgi:alpha/beta hydrolase family protein